MADKGTEKEQGGICRIIRDRYENSVQVWQHYWEGIRETRNFLDGDRYDRDPGPYNRDRRLIQIRGQEIQDTVRHVVSETTASPRSIEARAIDRIDDPDAAEIASAVVELEMSNPLKMFTDTEEEVITSARESRLGVMWMDWDPDEGPYGEILFRWQDGAHVMWDPAYHPHHLKCGWFWYSLRCDVDWIHATYKGSDWVKADRNAYLDNGKLQEGIPLLEHGHRALGRSIAYNDNKATLWFYWQKNDRTYKKRAKPDSEVALEPDERYMACEECGYRSPTQGTLIEEGKIETELPSELPGCPECAAKGMPDVPLRRVDALAETETVLAYTKGRRLTVMAPFSANKDDEPVADRSWPIPRARSFPCMIVTSYIKPGAPMGPADTDLMWDQQIASDHLRTMGLQRVFEHRNYWEMPRAGIVDSRGQRWNARDDQRNIMYRDNSLAQFGDMSVTLHQGSGIDPYFGQVFEITQQALTQYRGITDVGLTQENAAQMSGVAIAQTDRMGKITIEHFKRRISRERGRFAGVLWDYIAATYTPERVQALNIDGLDVLLKMAGTDFPNFNFVIEDSPPFTGLEKSRAEAAQAMIQFALNPQTAPFLDIYAEANSLPRSIIRKIEKRLEEQRAEAEEAMAMGMPPPGAEGMEPPDMGADAGLNGSGMEPDLEAIQG